VAFKTPIFMLQIGRSVFAYKFFRIQTTIVSSIWTSSSSSASAAAVPAAQYKTIYRLQSRPNVQWRVVVADQTNKVGVRWLQQASAADHVSM